MFYCKRNLSGAKNNRTEGAYFDGKTEIKKEERRSNIQITDVVFMIRNNIFKTDKMQFRMAQVFPFKSVSCMKYRSGNKMPVNGESAFSFQLSVSGFNRFRPLLLLLPLQISIL